MSIHNIIEYHFRGIPFFLMPFPWNTMLMVCLAIQVPFWISKFFADDFGVPIPTRELFWSLILTLLIPLILGKVPSSAFSSSYCTEVSLILGKYLNTSYFIFFSEAEIIKFGCSRKTSNYLFPN